MCCSEVQGTLSIFMLCRWHMICCTTCSNTQGLAELQMLWYTWVLLHFKCSNMHGLKIKWVPAWLGESRTASNHVYIHKYMLAYGGRRTLQPSHSKKKHPRVKKWGEGRPRLDLLVSSIQIRWFKHMARAMQCWTNRVYKRKIHRIGVLTRASLRKYW